MNGAAEIDDELVPRSVGRVLDLLEIVLGEPCTLTVAAGAAGLTPTTALRHLRALEARGYVSRDGGGRYGPGPTMLRLAASLGDSGLLQRLVAAAQPHLDALAAATGESAYLSISDGQSATYVATAESHRAIRHVGWVGQDVPLDGTAVGAALARRGVCVTRTGAVEPDITAVSRALPDDPLLDGLGVAVSIVGPQYRLRRAARRDTEAALVAATDAIARAVGVSAREAVS